MLGIGAVPLTVETTLGGHGMAANVDMGLFPDWLGESASSAGLVDYILRCLHNPRLNRGETNDGTGSAAQTAQREKAPTMHVSSAPHLLGRRNPVFQQPHH